MTELIIAVALAVGACYGMARVLKVGCARPRLPQANLARQNLIARAAAKRQATIARDRKLATAVRIALSQVRHAPDFRRAAYIVSKATSLPAGFRQGLFRHARQGLVAHFHALLLKGTSPQALMPGLTELVTALAVAPFEASYICQAAQRMAAARRPAAPDFTQQVRQANAQYRERLRAIDQLSDISDDMREQLREQELVRFEERVRSLSGGGAPEQ